MGEIETLGDGVRYDPRYNLRVTVFDEYGDSGQPHLTIDYHEDGGTGYSGGPVLIETDLTVEAIKQLRGQISGLSTSAAIFQLVEDAAKDHEDVFEKIRAVAEHKSAEEWY